MSAPARARTAGRKLPNWAIGVIAIFLVVFGLYMAFVKRLPFVPRGYEVKAVFANAQNVTVKSPVRIAGVAVGEVTAVEALPDQNAAVLTMEIKDNGRPIHEDARMQLRPRLFLEGNLFVDVRPGSPSADELDEGDTIPIQQTSNSVQLDQVLTALQGDVRGNLQLLLAELGTSFERYGAAEGFRQIYLSGAPAYKNTALVQQALLGTETRDLSNLVKNFDRVAQALDQNEPQLQDLITNLRIVTGSFAAEDAALQAAIRELPLVLDAAEPALANLNTALPFVRAFAREALPGVRSSGPTIDASLPLLTQLRGLVSGGELRGLVADLRPTIPQLTKLTRRQIPFLEESRALASCFNEVIIPWSGDRVGNGQTDGAGDPISRNYEETGYGLTGIAGESRSGDGNGQYIRVGAGGGLNTVLSVTPGFGQTVGVVPFPIEGSEPALNDSARTKFKPKVPCETQEAPDLRSSNGPAPRQFESSSGFQSILESAYADTELGRISREAAELYMALNADPQDVSAGLVRRSARNGDSPNELLARLLEFQRESLPIYEQLDLAEILGGGGN